MEDSNKTLVVSKDQGVLTIRLNNPKKKNSMTGGMTAELIEILEKAIKDDSIKVIYFTSTGEFFSSGNDFNNFGELGRDGLIENFQRFIDYLIHYPKVLIAGVNGPSVGVSFTMLSLFDIILCSDIAFFTVPFIQTYQTPEGCSSLLFPILLGKSMANHLLLNGGIMTAEEAKNLGFVTAIYDKDSFVTDAYDYAVKVAKHPTKNLMMIKEIIARNFRSKLVEVNKEECLDLRASWNQKEFQDVIKKFVKNPKF